MRYGCFYELANSSPLLFLRNIVLYPPSLQKEATKTKGTHLIIFTVEYAFLTLSIPDPISQMVRFSEAPALRIHKLPLFPVVG